MSKPHIPVLLQEFIDGFLGYRLTTFVDGTLGAAGHAKAILEKHEEIEKFIGCDQDKIALEIASKELEPWKDKIDLVHENFSKIDKVLEERKIKSIDGFFCDIGLSTMQLESEDRGFSFLKDAPLDMRMNQDSRLTAKEIVNKFSQKELGRIFKEYGEERKWKAAAEAIVIYRGKRRIETVEDLKEALKNVFPTRGKLNPLTLIFQALRIVVNDELKNLEKGLEKAIDYLKTGALIGVISFHSLEDRIVKQMFKNRSDLEVISKKPIVASNMEIKKNRRSRSAKLRFAKKVGAR